MMSASGAPSSQSKIKIISSSSHIRVVRSLATGREPIATPRVL
jgi:hypothetical protein